MAEFDDERIKRIAKLVDEQNKKDIANWNAESIFERLDSAIIGNETYKKSLAVTLANYLAPERRRDHLLVTGPSGTGKTYLLEQTLPDFGLPYIVIDTSSLVPSGYKGTSLNELLTPFFSSGQNPGKGAVIVLDEFDKISEKANGGDTHKSHSIQGELLTLIQGKKEAGIDTTQSLWILLGAFAYSDEMKRPPYKISKTDMLKYGLKNELLGRITKVTSTEMPTTEQVLKRIIHHASFKAFLSDMKRDGFDIDFEDLALLELSKAAQEPSFGMRIIPSILSFLQEKITFGGKKGTITVTSAEIIEAKK